MILTGKKIISEFKNGRITITPFRSDQVQPNSYKLRLGNELEIYEDKILDARNKNKTRKINIPEEGYILDPKKIYLSYSEEKIGSNYYAILLKGRSSVGRLGLFVTITSDLIDMGADEKCQLILHAVQKIKIYPGMIIGQVTFWTIDDN